MLARDELLASRLDALDALEKGLGVTGAQELSSEELTSWMTAVNDVRLVLGTVLDVQEDEGPVARGDSRAPGLAAYDVLTHVLARIVRRPARRPSADDDRRARADLEGMLTAGSVPLHPERGSETVARPRPPSSSGLGHRPFKAAARVRIPLGAPVGSRSRGAVWSARRPVKPEVAGSNPVGTASLAQQRGEPRSGSSVGRASA